MACPVVSRRHYEVLFNGVELDTYRSAAAYPTDGPTIFFCGRHEERKGLDVLLSALRRSPTTSACGSAATARTRPG